MYMARQSTAGSTASGSECRSLHLSRLYLAWHILSVRYETKLDHLYALSPMQLLTILEKADFAVQLKYCEKDVGWLRCYAAFPKDANHEAMGSSILATLP